MKISLEILDDARTLARDIGISVNVARFVASAAVGENVPIDATLIVEQDAIFRRYKTAGVISAGPYHKGGYIPDFNGAARAHPSALRDSL